MSTFDGVIKEYPLITIDNFVEECDNFKSTVFFLSHCHSDHMRGLGSKKFFELLEYRGFSNIYVSDVSEHLLKNDDYYSHLSHYLVSLPLEEPTIVVVPDENGSFHSRVVITLLSAGHCPGSVMILIEGQNGRVLYTGDFRIPVGGSARLPNLHEENGGLKPLDSLYIDTTFCSRNCLYIPTREQCLAAILSLVEPWLAKGPNHIVCFSCPAQYAYEFVFVELYQKLGEKTHVTEEKLRKYKGIKFIEDAVTSIPTEARIHSCTEGNASLFFERIFIDETPCGFHTSDHSPIKVMLIRPSAMFFGHNEFADIIQYQSFSQLHRVCYSTHSSLSEIRDMVKYLKPKVVYPNVVRGKSVEEILTLIHAPILHEDSPYSTPSPLGPLNNLKNHDDDVVSSGGLPFYDECYEIPRKLQTVDVLSMTAINPTVNQILSDIFSSDKTKSSEGTMFQCESEQNDSIQENSVVKNSDNASKIKWNSSLSSSDDENLNPNYYRIPKEKSDSDITSWNSEEHNIKGIATLLNSPESKISKTFSSPKQILNKNAHRFIHKINIEGTTCGSVNDSEKPLEFKEKITEINLHHPISEISENERNDSIQLNSVLKNSDGPSEIKWNYSLSSSDDGNLDPNFHSPDEKSDSDITPGNSEEQNIRTIDTLLNSPDSKVTTTSSPQNHQNTNNNALRFIHKINIGTSTCGYVTDSKKSVEVKEKITEVDSHLPNTEMDFHGSNTEIPETPLNEIVNYKNCSNKIQKPAQSSSSYINNNYAHTSPISHKSLCKSQSISCLSGYGNLPNVDRNLEPSAIPVSIPQSTNPNISDSTASWRNSKLDGIEIRDSKPMSSSNKETLVNDGIINQKIVGKCIKNRSTECHSSPEDLVFFSKTSKSVSEGQLKLNIDLIVYGDNKADSRTSEKEVAESNVYTSHSIINAPTLNPICEENKISKPNVGIVSVNQSFLKSVEFHETNRLIGKVANVNQNLKFPFENKIQGKSVVQTNSSTPVSRLFNDNSFKSKPHKECSTSSKYYSQKIFFPNPLRDISASKFEKSILKVKKKLTDLKVTTQEHDDDDVLVMSSQCNKRNSKSTVIDVIDLSSDDSIEEISVIEETSKLEQKTSTCSVKMCSNSKHPQLVCSKDSSDLEILDDSPSLITVKNTSKELLPVEKPSNNRVCTLKRKSDENEFMFIKSLRRETSSDYYVENEDDWGIDSTPEDLFPN